MLIFLFYNVFKHMTKLRQKPFTIIVFYTSACVTFFAIIVAFTVIRDPTSTDIIVSFSAVFVAEWGYQIIGVA